MMKLNLVISLAVFCMVAIGVSHSLAQHQAAVAGLSCNQVTIRLASCLGYLRKGGSPSFGCCNGVKAVNNAAQTTPDRQSTCRCLKSLYQTIPGINLGYAEKLPGICGVNVPYPIRLDTDCSKVK